MDEKIGRMTVQRITKAMERVNALQALLDVVAAEVSGASSASS